MPTIAELDLPTWGRLYVWRLPEVVRKAFAKCLGELRTKRRRREVRAKLIARCLVDANLQPVFTDNDWPAIARKPEPELAHVFKVACAINRIEVN
jgi:hypothetical protein